MPALVKRREGSFWGTREELETMRCPLSAKYVRKAFRISFDVMILDASPSSGCFRTRGFSEFRLLFFCSLALLLLASFKIVPTGITRRQYTFDPEGKVVGIAAMFQRLIIGDERFVQQKH